MLLSVEIVTLMLMTPLSYFTGGRNKLQHLIRAGSDDSIQQPFFLQNLSPLLRSSAKDYPYTP